MFGLRFSPGVLTSDFYFSPITVHLLVTWKAPLLYANLYTFHRLWHFPYSSLYLPCLAMSCVNAIALNYCKCIRSSHCYFFFPLLIPKLFLDTFAVYSSKMELICQVWKSPLVFYWYEENWYGMVLLSQNSAYCFILLNFPCYLLVRSWDLSYNPWGIYY